MKEKFDDKNLDSLFRDKFAGEETAPREIVWTKISQQLGEKDRRPGVWIWWLSGLVLVGGISLFLLSGKGRNAELPVGSDVVTKGNSIETENKKKIIAETKQANQNDSAYHYQNDAAVKNNSLVKTNSSDKNSSGNTADDKIVADKKTKQLRQKMPSAVNEEDKPSSGIHRKSGKSIVPHHSNPPKKNNSENSSGNKPKSTESDPGHISKNTSSSVSTKPNVPDTTANSSVNSNPSEKKSFALNPVPANTSLLNRNTITDAKSKPDSVASLPKVSLTENIFNPHADIIPSIEINYPPEKLDSAELYRDNSSDSIRPNPDQFFPVAQEPSFVFPKYYAGLHGAVDQGKIIQSEVYDDDYDNEDVAVYDKTKLNSLPQQSYSFGGRFGWFFSKRFSLTGGAYYSIFQSSSGEGNFKFNHNISYNFSMHSATASVQCPSSRFDMNDAYHRNFDTVYIAIQSQERYDYVNLQLGFSFYAFRKKHFGLYADLLSNGAYLAKQQMTLTVPYSGKTLSYSGNELKGMNKFVMGGQSGIGFEYLPFGKLGLWLEPSFYFSGSLNKENAVRLQPGGMRYSFGLIYHF